MKAKIKILHIMNGAVLGGISTVVRNYYEHVNRDKFSFDCAMHNPNLGPNGISLKKNGCDMFFLPLKSKNIIKYIISLMRIIKNGGYDVIHVHDGKTAYVALLVGKVLGVSVRIAHAHTSLKGRGFKGRTKDYVSQFMNPLFATTLLACSKSAARVVFGDSWSAKHKIFILKNAIDVGRFSFDPEIRNRIRNELGIKNELVIGTVGNLDPIKNHKYLLEIFMELCKIKKEVMLVIIGKGALLKDLRDYAYALGVSDRVSFLGQRTDVNQVLMALDIFVMPSLNEGFSIAALEAAASGLPIFLSDEIPKRLNFVSHSKFISINIKPELWAREIYNCPLDYNRLNGASEVIKNGFDIRESAQQLEKIYET